MAHAICAKARVMYFPAPKNGGTSIRACLFEIDNGWPYRPMIIDGETIELHRLLASPLRFEPAHERPGFLKFCVVRDPIQRLVSAYRYCVLRIPERITGATSRHGVRDDLPRVPDLSTFVRNLDEYRKVPKIAHHTNPQAYFLGDDLAYYDRVFRFEDVQALEQFLGERTGTPVTLPRLNTGAAAGSPGTLSAEEREMVAGRYAQDYALLEGYY